MKNQKFLCSLVFLLLFMPSLLAAKWPREIGFKSGGKVIIYQPQPEELVGNKITAHMAIAAKEKAADPLVFGAMFVDGVISTEKDKHKATLQSIKITNAKIDGLADTAKMAKLIKLIETEVPKWNLEISTDELAATLKAQQKTYETYNNDPPKIIYTEKASTLVYIDGDPKIQKDKNFDADRVMNTPFLIFKEGQVWNMYIGGIWYQSSQVTSGWAQSKSMSKKVKSVDEQIKKQEKEQNGGKAPTEKPKVTAIVVSQVPTELIQTAGKVTWKKIDSTSLQYASNSTNDILKTADGNIYILLTGRWFRSSSFNGPWVYVESDKLPADFAKIPEGSEKDNVLVSVSGTPAADEAIIDALIPQTAKVERKTATIKVEYDGDPQLEAIEGTTLQRVKNSNLTVLKEPGGDFFALDNGVWFTGTNVKGPWKLSDRRPNDIDNIPAKCVAYNSKFVYIYETAPDYVITGYTGGYLNNYVQGDPTIIFGTGFHYTPWFGALFFPVPCTWGFCFGYNPYTGWSMGMTYSVGFVTFGFGMPMFGYGGWYGPPYYHPPYRPPYYGGGYYGRGNHVSHYGNTNINIDNSHNNIYRGGANGNNNRPGISNQPATKPGSSYRPNNGAGNKGPSVNPNDRAGAANKANNRPASTAPRPSNQPNNVFADKGGNVYQRDNKGNVNMRDNSQNSWNRATSFDNGMQRDMQARDRGSSRSQNYNRASSQSMNRSYGGGGGMRGGGGGRRR